MLTKRKTSTRKKTTTRKSTRGARKASSVKIPKTLKDAGFKVTQALLNKARKQGGISLTVAKQTGGTTKHVDRRLSALLPGYRLSRTGRIYKETRKNRSDKGMI